MDYNFNLKSSQKKFSMPFLQSNINRCFSTSNSLEGHPCMANKLNVEPFIDFISGLKSKTINCQTKSSGAAPLQSRSYSCSSTMPLSSFPSKPIANRSMSVSCIVGGLVGSDNAMKTSQKYCDNLLVIGEVFLNKFSPDKAQVAVHENINEALKLEKKIEIPKRTYAEVTKEKPKPREFLNSHTSSIPQVSTINCVSIDASKRSTKSCDNIFVQMSSTRTNSHDQEILPHVSSSIPKLCPETTFNPGICRLKSSSSSSDSSENDKSMSRTLSECSIESDDSFIVFENDDEGTFCDISDEESSDEEISDEGTTISPCSDTVTSSSEESPPKNGKKMVKWKNERELVKIHPLVVWDFASRAARVGHWEKYRIDRDRFKNRIQMASSTLNPILDPAHRLKVFSERFTPP